MATFFATAGEFVAWLEKHGATQTEFLVGYYKRASKRPSMTWAESVDAALCFGWIDGVRKRIDEHSYQIRFTPRKPTSIWSRINIDRAHVLRRSGQMRQAGLKSFSQRHEHKSRIYSYEQQKAATLERADELRFRRAKAAWKFFEAQPQSYRQLLIWRIVTAKRLATRERRLAALIQASAERRRL
jgi:uncharacterized protein YdeI (YjbR/CyaY-like superfamily)